MSSRKIDSNSTAVSIFNTTAETTVVTVAAPALTIRSQGATRLTAVGRVENAEATGAQWTLRVKAYDGTTTATVLATSGIVCSTSTANRLWMVDAIMYGEATNVQTHWGTVDMTSPTTGTVAPSTYSANGYGGSTLDDLQPIVVTVTAQASVASTGMTFYMEDALFEAIT